ncbi:hypothetical protein N7E70_018175 [Aminobacter sp. NyZ550]|uniref:hypothetical protein n=1 Tax=Aminobacter sp. NyZ550 TaxID=2979870 RepID=UPI0021D5CC35|nr:hypothetical protein [Aminobacter sp. NyZ550]WAX93604.1 hypothetical protein N7E70_018175 [Aminobacter sp. NyZ550]
MKRRLLDLITRNLLLIVVLTGAAACTTPRGSICLGPDLRYRQEVYDAMNEAEVARHLAALKMREELCGRMP